MHSNKLIICLLMLAIAANSCVKQKFDTPSLAEFAAPVAGNQGSYFILPNDPSSEFKIPIGITTTSSKDRTINFTVTSPTGAVAGTQYTIDASSITIPAGKVIDSISVKGLYSGYPSAKVDTLIFTITGGDAPAFSGSDTYTLIMQKYCDVVSTDLVGDYTSTVDYYKGTPSDQGAYTATVSDWTSTGPTSATIKIKNLGWTSDVGFGDTDPVNYSTPGFLTNDPAALGLTAKLDWTNPSNFTVTIASQPYLLDTYGGGPGKINGSGTFSSCSERLSITFTVTDAGGLVYGPVTTVLNK